MIQITLSAYSPSLESINSLLSQHGQSGFKSDLSKNPEQRWLSAISRLEARDHITITILALGMPMLLEDLTTILNQPGIILLEPMRLFTVPLSYLEDRVARFKNDPGYRIVIQQLANGLIQFK